jgi:hypothetical protein
MTATVATVAYLGLEARPVEVQVQLSAGLPRFTIVGLPDKAVAESRERVHAALASIGLALPPKRITVNLSPADLPKEGSRRRTTRAASCLPTRRQRCACLLAASTGCFAWRERSLTLPGLSRSDGCMWRRRSATGGRHPGISCGWEMTG